jgi:hypothetical protein
VTLKYPLITSGGDQLVLTTEMSILGGWGEWAGEQTQLGRRVIARRKTVPEKEITPGSARA